MKSAIQLTESDLALLREQHIAWEIEEFESEEYWEPVHISPWVWFACSVLVALELWGWGFALYHLLRWIFQGGK